MLRSSNLVVRWLRGRELPLYWRYASATAIMAAGFVVQQLLIRFANLPGLSVLIVLIFVCAVLYGRGTGFYAAALANAAAAYSVGVLAFSVPVVPGFLLFAAMSLLSAGCGEALRLAYERAMRSDERSQLLLKELHHRTQNTLSVIVSLIEMQARASSNPDVNEALRMASTRVRIQSEAHRHLDFDTTGTVDARDYLKEVCNLAEQALGGMRPIAIICDAQRTTIGAHKTLAIGLIASELITNALKYAFRDGETGTISVKLERRNDGYIRLSVADDGHGYPDEVTPGMGTQLLRAMVKVHKGTYEQRNLEKGCEVVVTFAPRQNWALSDAAADAR